MLNPIVSDPNDFKVVDFTNKTDFTFTPEMGCMFDGRPIFGITGAPGINGGESMKLPYHVGQRLAINLAKVAMTRQAPAVDPAGIPTGVPLWDTVKLDSLKNSYLTDLYTQEKPIAQTETERLMKQVEELNKLVVGMADKIGQPAPAPVIEPVAIVVEPSVIPAEMTPPSDVVLPEIKLPEDKPSALKQAYLDKQDIIKELERRGIPHDKRKGGAELKKLLANS